MKKITITLLAVLAFQFTSAQEFPQHEVKFNIANVIAIASVELGYEYFFAENQSLEAEALFNDRINYHSEKGSRKFNTSSLKAGYNFYFGGENPGSGIFLNPFIKTRFGDFEEVIQDQLVTTDMNTFIIGLGGGHKWNFSNAFIVSIYGSIGRNFSKEVEERFSSLEFHSGLGIGYRF